MADEPTTETVTTEVEKTEEKRVPYERFQKVNESKRDLESQLAQAKQALEERETQDLGEVDKLRRAAEKSEQRAQEFEQRATKEAERATNLERAGWVRSEASKLGFTDPEDAVAFVVLGEIEDHKAAEREVKQLAGRKEHLLAKKAEEASPGLAKILSPTGTETTTQTAAPGGASAPGQAEAEAQMLAEGLKQFVRR